MKISKEKLEQAFEQDVMAVRKVLSEYEINWDEVDDLTQEVFTRAVEADFNGRSSVVTWLCGIAHNVGVDHVRQKSAEKRANEVLEVYVEVDDEASPYYDRYDLSTSLADEQERLDPALIAEADQTLECATDQMPEQMAVVVTMRLEGFTNPQIAETLGLSEGYVRKLISSAKNFFAEGNNSQFNTTNTIREGEERVERHEPSAPTQPLERLSANAMLERIAERFARRSSALSLRLARIAEAAEFAARGEQWTLAKSRVKEDTGCRNESLLPW